MDYIVMRDKALNVILNMSDELTRLEAENQALEAENMRLRASSVVLPSAEKVGAGSIERKVFEYGCKRLVDECFYTWNKVVQSSETDEKAPCPFEQWRMSAFRHTYLPDWVSTDQLFEVLDPQLRRLYAEQVSEFMEDE